METLLSVGIDIGTTTTQLVISRLTLQNTRSAFSVPSFEIAQKEVLFRSDIHFTPLLSDTQIDAQGVRDIVEAEYRASGFEKGDIRTGAVIITGETARKENARQVLDALAGFAGDFVVATAGPALESVLAGKGAGADEAVSALKNTKGVSGAVVSVGGTVGVFGKNPNSDHWGVGVRKPERDNTGYIAVIKLYKDSFVSTSGSYEKYFELDGKTYHHILSPFTGYPAESGLKSVTVVTYDSGVYADSLSTACFVLGYEKSLSLLEKYSADAFFILDDGSVKMTDGIKDNVTMNE